jgi:hypothetical protein
METVHIFRGFVGVFLVNGNDVNRFPLARKVTTSEEMVEDGTETWCNLLIPFLQEF